jgi:hypothetical protein
MRTSPAVLFLAVLPGLACDSGLGSVCTTEFRTVPVTVVDRADTPIADASVVAVLVRTSDTLSPPVSGPSPTGVYIIVDDGSRHKILTAGELVRVQVERGAQAFGADYVFDVPGGCHIHKVSGPDTLTAP